MKNLGHFLIVLVTAILTLGSTIISPVLAQEPVTWQESARGLSLTQNDEKKTAGLGFMVQAESWPTLWLRGGVKDGGWNKIAGPVGIDLGTITIPNGQTISLSNEATDWAHNELTFSIDAASQLKLWVSRLTPAILVQSSTNVLRLLSGNVSGNTFDGSRINTRPEGPVYPKYVAYQNNGNIQVHSLSSTEISLPALDQNWLLLWYGDNSHFVETKKPLTYGRGQIRTASVPHREAYQADAPLLLVFENRPVTIKHSAEGGIDLTFASSAGYVTLLPLLGRDHPRSLETESWSQGIPNAITQKAQWWASHLCAYPVEVSETYGYDKNTDTASITESMTFLQVCSGGTQFAPLPPMLGLVKDTLGVTFSATIVDSDFPTEFGPIYGIENSAQYTWSVSGLKAYSDERRMVADTTGSTDLEAKLAAEVDKIITAGHFAPWLFLDAIPRQSCRGDLYWANPADTLYHLIETVDAIPDINLKNELINYIRSERLAYPPEDVFNLNLTGGTIRGAYSYLDDSVLYCWNENTTADGTRQDAFLKDVPLYTYYALARYYELTGDVLSAAVQQKAKAALDRDMSEQDWATFYWFNGHQDRRIAVVNTNRYFAGLIGLVTSARMAGDQETEDLGRALLAKAAVLRLGMAQYPRYLFNAGLVELPPEPDWQPQYTAGEWMGHLYNYNWTDSLDDPRQVALLDQFGVFLYDQSGIMESWQTDWNKGPTSSHLIAYQDMIPELARFLADYAREDAEIYANKVEALFPHWYAAFAEGMLGGEHNLSHPIDSYQIFMAKAWIEQESPDKLAVYTDIPWLEAGDLFYIQKLAETIKAYRGYTWVPE